MADVGEACSEFLQADDPVGDREQSPTYFPRAPSGCHVY